MSRRKKIHLFNCDHLYELRVIEDLLYSSKPKLGFDFIVENHYFFLPEMNELSEKVIPALKMDFAVFVVHAHESRLSINDGHGYTTLYRALLQATGGNVLIVIGGDDNYKNKVEEERSVISLWARRIVTAQFSEEFLDGRKSFIFSWDKGHRPIHEEALMHFFEADKKSEKFENQLPTDEPARVKPAEPIPTEVEENKCPSDTGTKDEVGRHDVKPSGVEDENAQQQQESYKPAIPTHTKHGPLTGKLVLKSKLRFGRISYAPSDVEFLSPEFRGFRDDATQRLLEGYKLIDEIQLKLMSVGNDLLVFVGDQGIEMANNDLLLLRTRVIKGVVSFHEDDVKFRHPGWKVPTYILEDLKRKASTGQIFIISDEKGNLRCIVQSEAMDRVFGAKDKVLAFLTTSNAFKILF